MKDKIFNLFPISILIIAIGFTYSMIVTPNDLKHHAPIIRKALYLKDDIDRMWGEIDILRNEIRNIEDHINIRMDALELEDATTRIPPINVNDSI